MAGMFSLSGSTRNTMNFLKRMEAGGLLESLEALAQQGVNVLQASTPIDSGLTASSWGYEIVPTRDGVKIQWTNDNIEDGVNVAVLIQYGHATGNGAYISGYDYINPAMQPIFIGLAEEIWRKVTLA